MYSTTRMLILPVPVSDYFCRNLNRQISVWNYMGFLRQPLDIGWSPHNIHFWLAWTHICSVFISTLILLLHPDRYSSADGDDEMEEEDDQFTCHKSFRPRSTTCPENREWRKRKLRGMRRPGTPPPAQSTSPVPPTSQSVDVTPEPSLPPPSEHFLQPAAFPRRHSYDVTSIMEEED